MQRIEFRAMGGQILAIVDTHGEQALDCLQATPRWFAVWERTFSRFDKQSELSRLNRNAGRTVRVSPELWEVIAESVRAAQRSAGLVTPTLLAELEQAGYAESFSRSVAPESEQSEATDAAASSEQHVNVLPAYGNWKSITLYARTRSIRVPHGMRLDLGGVAKGWAAEQAADHLSRHGPALVDAGGDIAVSGPRADGSPWPIGIANPFDPDAQLDMILIGHGGVATSGRDYRRWRKHGDWQHHIIDPHTGRPATTDLVSVTVIAPSVREAEVAAKAAFILGSRDGLAWIDEQPALAALLVGENGRLLRSRQFARYAWSSVGYALDT